MQGRRIPAPPMSWAEGECPYGPGDYWRDDGGRWNGVTPNGLLAAMARHAVAEHADGSITVSPSILTSDGRAQWHGYLKQGVWEECK